MCGDHPARVLGRSKLNGFLSRRNTASHRCYCPADTRRLRDERRSPPVRPNDIGNRFHFLSKECDKKQKPPDRTAFCKMLFQAFPTLALSKSGTVEGHTFLSACSTSSRAFYCHITVYTIIFIFARLFYKYSAGQDFPNRILNCEDKAGKLFLQNIQINLPAPLKGHNIIIGLNILP